MLGRLLAFGLIFSFSIAYAGETNKKDYYDQNEYRKVIFDSAVTINPMSYIFVGYIYGEQLIINSIVKRILTGYPSGKYQTDYG